MVTLGLDYGDRYIGIAATESGGTLTYRYGTIDQTAMEALPELCTVVERENVTRVVVGFPMGMDGQATEQTGKTSRFADTLAAALPAEVAVVRFDERLTTKLAKSAAQAEGRVEEEHAEAARLILEGFLGSQKRRSDPLPN